MRTTRANSNVLLALTLFSTKEGAESYVRTLIERYSLERVLSLHGKQLAPDAGNSALGLRPSVREQALDEGIDTLPGAWMVKVDETLRMTSCAFSTEHTPTRSAIHIAPAFSHLRSVRLNTPRRPRSGAQDDGVLHGSEPFVAIALP